MGAAHPLKVYITTTDTAPVAGDEADGIKSVGWGPSRTVLDTTDFKDASGAKTKILGLSDGQVTLSGDYEEGDTPQDNLLAAFASGDSVWVHFRPTGGATGFKVECKVESYEIGGEVDDLVTIDFTLAFTGAITIV